MNLIMEDHIRANTESFRRNAVPHPTNPFITSHFGRPPALPIHPTPDWTGQRRLSLPSLQPAPILWRTPNLPRDEVSRNLYNPTLLSQPHLVYQEIPVPIEEKNFHPKNSLFTKQNNIDHIQLLRDGSTSNTNFSTEHVSRAGIHITSQPHVMRRSSTVLDNHTFQYQVPAPESTKQLNGKFWDYSPAQKNLPRFSDPVVCEPEPSPISLSQNLPSQTSQPYYHHQYMFPRSPPTLEDPAKNETGCCKCLFCTSTPFKPKFKKNTDLIPRLDQNINQQALKNFQFMQSLRDLSVSSKSSSPEASQIAEPSQSQSSSTNYLDNGVNVDIKQAYSSSDLTELSGGVRRIKPEDHRDWENVKGIYNLYASMHNRKKRTVRELQIQFWRMVNYPEPVDSPECPLEFKIAKEAQEAIERLHSPPIISESPISFSWDKIDEKSDEEVGNVPTAFASLPKTIIDQIKNSWSKIEPYETSLGGCKESDSGTSLEKFSPSSQVQHEDNAPTTVVSHTPLNESRPSSSNLESVLFMNSKDIKKAMAEDLANDPMMPSGTQRTPQKEPNNQDGNNQEIILLYKIRLEEAHERITFLEEKVLRMQLEKADEGRNLSNRMQEIDSKVDMAVEKFTGLLSEKDKQLIRVDLELHRLEQKHQDQLSDLEKANKELHLSLIKKQHEVDILRSQLNSLTGIRNPPFHSNPSYEP